MSADLRTRFRDPASETPFARFVLIAIAVVFMAVILLLPLLLVFIEAFRRGAGAFFEALGEPDTLSAIV